MAADGRFIIARASLSCASMFIVFFPSPQVQTGDGSYIVVAHTAAAVRLRGMPTGEEEQRRPARSGKRKTPVDY